ncbi:MAG: rhomboid-like protein [Gaiellaceae bacterium]
MGLLAVVVLVAILIRIERAERWPVLDRWRARWRPWERRAGDYVRSAPFTYIYFSILLVTTWVLQSSSSSVAHRVLLDQSTNLHQLDHDPIRVLIGSAFWLPSGEQIFIWLALFSLVLAPVERWLGSARTALVFAVGHVGATLLVATGLWFAVHADIVERQVTHAEDVGVSYGFFAVAALLTLRLPPRWRPAYLLSVLVYLSLAAALDATFTDFGHLAALGLGALTALPVTRFRRTREAASADGAGAHTVPLPEALPTEQSQGRRNVA